MKRKRVRPKATKLSVLRNLFSALCILGGLALALYPILGSAINDISFSNAVSHYEDEVSNIPEEVRESMLAAAKDYNDSLRGDPVHDPFVANTGSAIPDNYNDVLNVDGQGLIGTIEIPSINVKLPIRHSTADKVLVQGAGHIPQTSFPIGGLGTHAVITGHTGLPTARLFTDLVQLREGDKFIINILGEKRAYAVDNITVVLPSDLSRIRLDSQHDYITLLTCTPYGLNTHRLLVRGSPTDMPSYSDSSMDTPWQVLIVVGLILLILLVSLANIVRRFRRAHG